MGPETATSAARGVAPPTGRRNRDADVVAAAINVFWRKGYADASVQDLADEVGVLKGSLYHYIESKEALLMRVFDLAHEQAQETIDYAAALDVPPLERVRRYFERHVRWYLDNIEHASVFFREWRSLTGPNLQTVKRRRRSYARFIGGMIEECRLAGATAPGVDSRIVLVYVLSAVNAAPDWYRREGPDDAGTIAAAYADFVVGTLVGAA
ncbi:MAG: TetR/AcrR family transcriptional regulator [Solirubrobacterales bacterium]|nr:TetR/AcrR family transcriptional regulator [Solirubrobacterales bacterium]